MENQLWRPLIGKSRKKKKKYPVLCTAKKRFTLHPLFIPVSRPGVVTGSRTMYILNIADAIPLKFVHITHECMDSTKLIM